MGNPKPRGAAPAGMLGWPKCPGPFVIEPGAAAARAPMQGGAPCMMPASCHAHLAARLPLQSRLHLVLLLLAGLPRAEAPPSAVSPGVGTGLGWAAGTYSRLAPTNTASPPARSAGPTAAPRGPEWKPSPCCSTGRRLPCCCVVKIQQEGGGTRGEAGVSMPRCWPRLNSADGGAHKRQGVRGRRVQNERMGS